MFIHIISIYFVDVCSGVTVDWTADIGIPLNYLFELRDTGEHGFILPPDQIIPTGRELLMAMDVLHTQVITRGN